MTLRINTTNALKRRICLLLLAIIFFMPNIVSADLITEPLQFEQLDYDKHHELNDYLNQSSYDWDTLDQGVPRFILTSLPEDMANVPRVSDKKRIFFLSLLPMVLLANNEIEADRKRLLGLKQHDASRHHEVETQDIIWVRKLAKKYGIKKDPLASTKVMHQLLERVDRIPASLVLAQAANESGWGTSRFSRLANNIFGEWTFTPGTGLKPLDRPEGKTYEVRLFDNVLASIRSYLNNLNSHRAYRDLRKKRAELNHAGMPVRGVDLAQHLENYSTRRQAYVKEIRDMIQHNNLTRLADVSLRQPAPPPKAPTYGLFSSAKLSGRRQLQPTD